MPHCGILFVTLCGTDLQVSGSLLAASAVHMLLGGSGLMGLLMRFIGPLTISPVLVLIAVSLVAPTAELMEAHWGVAAL